MPNRWVAYLGSLQQPTTSTRSSTYLWTFASTKTRGKLCERPCGKWNGRTVLHNGPPRGLQSAQLIHTSKIVGIIALPHRKQSSPRSTPSRAIGGMRSGMLRRMNGTMKAATKAIQRTVSSLRKMVMIESSGVTLPWRRSRWGETWSHSSSFGDRHSIPLLSLSWYQWLRLSSALLLLEYCNDEKIEKDWKWYNSEGHERPDLDRIWSQLLNELICVSILFSPFCWFLLNMRCNVCMFHWVVLLATITSLFSQVGSQCKSQHNSLLHQQWLNWEDLLNFSRVAKWRGKYLWWKGRRPGKDA